MANNEDPVKKTRLLKPTWPPGYVRRVVVKFRDTAQFSDFLYDDRIENSPEQHLGRNWSQLLERFPGINIQRLITSVAPQQINELVERARNREEGKRSASLRPIRRGLARGPNNDPPNLLTYFSIPCPSGVKPQAVAEHLRKWGIPEPAGRHTDDQPSVSNGQSGIEVELAYVESGPTPPPTFTLSATEDPRNQGTQGYLTPAPIGIDAEYAWKITGGDGDTGAAGLQFVDIEQGWTINEPGLNPILTQDHEDLPVGIKCIWGVPRQNFGHGTGVLGIVLALPGNADGTVAVGKPGSKSCVGITPKVKNCMVASTWPDNSGKFLDRVNAIIHASSKMNPGDVLLLEDQVWAHGSLVWQKDKKYWYYCPVEIEDAINDAIWLATANGIVVIEAAGNSDTNLDDFIPDGNFYDWETDTEYSSGFAYWNAKRDSGAIVVAAADRTTHDPGLVSSNRGSRIDCFAWGDQISTTGDPDPYRVHIPGPHDYTVGFSGTSGASAIIAGAALAIQGIAQVHRKGDLSNDRFSPVQLRKILRNPANGTPSNKSTDKIGVMPNLEEIITHTLGIPPPPKLDKIERIRLTKPKKLRGPSPRQALRKQPATKKKKPK